MCSEMSEKLTSQLQRVHKKLIENEENLQQSCRDAIDQMEGTIERLKKIAVPLENARHGTDTAEAAKGTVRRDLKSYTCELLLHAVIK